MDNPYEDEDAAFKLVRIASHWCLEGILELEAEYSSGVKEFHPISLLKEEDPHVVAECVLRTNLGQTLNTIHHQWALAFLRTMRRVMR